MRYAASPQLGQQMHLHRVKRREFITLLGGAAAWPLAARAQQAMPAIGFLASQLPDAIPDQLRGFRQGLKDTGYVEGESAAIVYRFAENQDDRLPTLAAELVSRRVAVIATAGALPTFTATAATTTIPIVFLVGDDPVRLGLVTKLSRPGGNITGINILTSEVAAKRLELLRELLPQAARVAVLVNPANAGANETQLKDVGAAARATGLQIQIHNADTSAEIEAAFKTMSRERPDALFVTTTPFFNGRRLQLAQLAAFHRLPASYGLREYVEAGGLMSYGANVADAWRQVGSYVGRILKGAKPADLPVYRGMVGCNPRAEGSTYAAAQVHHSCRWRRHRLAARRPRAAARADAAHSSASGRRRQGRSALAAQHSGIPASAAAIGLDRRPKREG
jgi:putative ABC transport system substrate-binding protein